ncbi:hypothetical protein ACGFIP_04865 [Micromonospora zamorensis]|uniref:hypothetical protein n=1 Tax=Micromonospora zamorensis TaxID=709883 RepID=UPI00371FD898
MPFTVAIALQPWPFGIIIPALIASVALIAVTRRLKSRRRTDFTVTLAAMTAGAGVAATVMFFVQREHRDPLPSHASEMSVEYRAWASLDGSVLQVAEEITVDDNEHDAWPGGSGWHLDRTVDGKPIYRRERQATVHDKSRMQSEVTLPIQLGGGPIGTLVPALGSVIHITAPKGALGVMEPAPDQLVDLPRQRERASAPISRSDDYLVISIRPPWLRNPLGQKLDAVLAWGPGAWLVGFLAVLILTVVMGRLTVGVERVLGLLIPRRDRLEAPNPRRPLRGGGAGLVIRRKR